MDGFHSFSQKQSITAELVIKTSVVNVTTGVVRDEGWRGFGRFRTTADDIGVYRRCAVIRRVALCNRLSGERGAGGLGCCWWECVVVVVVGERGARGGVTRWRRCWRWECAKRWP